MKVSDFNYDLPEELIAQVPIKNRDESRLMVLNREDKTIEDKTFKDILDYLQPGDCLVRNNTKVIPARLYGIKEETGINEGICEEIYSLVHEGHHAIYYGYLFVASFDKKGIRLQEGETIDYKWITKNEVIDFYKTECSPTLKERLKDFIDSFEKENRVKIRVETCRCNYKLE